MGHDFFASAIPLLPKNAPEILLLGDETPPKPLEGAIDEKHPLSLFICSLESKSEGTSVSAELNCCCRKVFLDLNRISILLP